MLNRFQLNDKQQAELHELQTKASTKIKPEKDLVRKNFEKVELKKLTDAGTPEAEAKKMVKQLLQDEPVLPLSYELVGRTVGHIKVSALLADYDSYKNESFLDPFDDISSNNYRATLMMARNHKDKEPVVKLRSFDKGGRFYRLEGTKRNVGETEPPFKPRNKLVPVNVLTKQVLNVEWLVDKLIPRHGVFMAFGDPESCKSLWFQGMGFCIAAGLDFDGRATTQTKVVNYVGEGAEGLQVRYRALEIYHGVETDQLFNSEDPAMFMDSDYTDEIINDLLALGGVGLVCIDTLHRNFGNGDENTSKDFGLFMNNIDRLRKTVGCAVVIIHHSGHGDKSRSRGSSSIRGSLDAEFCVTKKDDFVTVSCAKMKNFSRSKMNLPLNYKMKEIQIDDENTSVVLEPTNYTTIKQAKDSPTARDYEILTHIKNALEVHGKPPLKPIPEWLGEQPAKVLSVPELRTFIYDSECIENSRRDGVRKAIKAALPRLENKLYIQTGGDDYLWFLEQDQ
jgi:hypothetical protein